MDRAEKNNMKNICRHRSAISARCISQSLVQTDHLGSVQTGMCFDGSKGPENSLRAIDRNAVNMAAFN